LEVAALAFLGIWEFNVPWEKLLSGGGNSQPTLRLLTCNVQYGDLRTGDLAGLIQETRPDIVLLQEYGSQDLRVVLDQSGWQVRTFGEFCLASKYPIVAFETVGSSETVPRIIAVCAKIRWLEMEIPVVSVHLMSPRAGLEGILRDPLSGLVTFRRVAAVQDLESEFLRRWVHEKAETTLLGGDFNLIPEHPLYIRDWADFMNAFSQSSWGLGHTMFTRHTGLRIDHVLCGSAWLPTSCRVGPDVGSAHRPVVAELIWRGPPSD
jgi:endonuclease/exonuclease/phosphatase (EEP) superfamily protein YafD